MAFTLDVCLTDDDKSKGTALQTAFSGLAGLIANGLGFVNFVEWIPSLFSSNYAAVFYIGVFIVFFTTLPTLLVKEVTNISGTKLLDQGTSTSVSSTQEEPFSIGKFFVNMFRALLKMTFPLACVLMLWFIANAAMYTKSSS